MNEEKQFYVTFVVSNAVLGIQKSNSAYKKKIKIYSRHQAEETLIVKSFNLVGLAFVFFFIFSVTDENNDLLIFPIK